MKLPTMLAAGLFFLAAPLAGQESLAPGTRIRVSTPVVHNGVEVARSAAWQTGTVKRMNATMLVLQTRGAEEIDIPISVIRKLEVSQGAMSSPQAFRQGLFRGAAGGGGMVLVTALFGKLAQDSGSCNGRGDDCLARSVFEPSRGELARNVGIGVAVGSGVGMIFGARAQERWTAVNLDRVDIVSGGAAGGTGVSVSLRL